MLSCGSDRDVAATGTINFCNYGGYSTITTTLTSDIPHIRKNMHNVRYTKAADNDTAGIRKVKPYT